MSSFAATSIGFMANNLLPARAGEFVRPVALSRMEPIPVTGAFGSLVVARTLDSIALLVFLLLAMASSRFPGADELGDVATVVGLATKAVGVLLFSIVMLVAFPRPIVRIAETMASRLPDRIGGWVVGGLEAFLAGFAALRDPVLLVKSVLWTIFFWCFHSLSFWVGFRAFGIDLDYVAAIFLNSIIGFAVAIPAGPGFFGTFELGVNIGLTGVYGIDPSTAAAFAVGYHLGSFIPITLIGLWFAWRLGISFSEVGSSEEVVEDQFADSGSDSVSDSVGDAAPGSDRRPG